MKQRSGANRLTRKRRCRSGTEAGFSLVEIAISVLVLGLGFTSLLSVVTVGIKWSQDAIFSSTGQFAAETWKSMVNEGANPDVATQVGYMQIRKPLTGAGDCFNSDRRYDCVTP